MDTLFLPIIIKNMALDILFGHSVINQNYFQLDTLVQELFPELFCILISPIIIKNFFWDILFGHSVYNIYFFSWTLRFKNIYQKSFFGPPVFTNHNEKTCFQILCLDTQLQTIIIFVWTLWFKNIFQNLFWHPHFTNYYKKKNFKIFFLDILLMILLFLVGHPVYNITIFIWTPCL